MQLCGEKNFQILTGDAFGQHWQGSSLIVDWSDSEGVLGLGDQVVQFPCCGSSIDFKLRGNQLFVLVVRKKMKITNGPRKHAATLCSKAISDVLLPSCHFPSVVKLLFHSWREFPASLGTVGAYA